MQIEKCETSEKVILEDFFPHIANFNHLNINLRTNSSRQNYHDEWIKRYRSHIKNWTDYDIAIWSIRCRQSLKLCFSATYFALASTEAREHKNLASAYFLAYYSAMHVMWAVLYLHPGQSTRNITDITHSKISNVFHSAYAHGNGSILSVNAKEFAEDLRFLREYYSYRMPLNSSIGASPTLLNVHASLGGFVKQSIQLAHLHSHLVHKASEREKKRSASIPPERIREFSDEFFLINGKEHVGRKLKLLDSADRASLSETVTKGCDIIPHIIGYEHMFDNYMTFSGDEYPDAKIIEKTKRLVGNALF